MGFFNFLLGNEKEEKENIQNENSPFNTSFINEKEEIDFEESIYGKIQLYSTDLFYIKEVLPERGIELEKQVNALTQLLELTNDERDLEVKKAFVEFELLFEKTKRMADGEYTLRQLNRQNREMDKTFETEPNIDKSQIDEYISYISKISEKVNDSDNTGKPLFTNVQKQRFNKIVMQSEYRLKMLELMHLLTKGMKSEVTINPFKDLSVTKQKIFSQLFFDDIETTQKQYNILTDSEEAFKNYGYSFDSIDKMAEKITNELADASMVEDFSIRQLFDSENQSVNSFEFLKEFVAFKRNLNSFMKQKERVIEEYNANQELERKKIEEAEEKKRREQERKEKLKNMSNSEINDEIYKIEHDLSNKGNRFINILDFQTEVAKEKGLLEGQKVIQKDDLSYYELESHQLPDLIQDANKAAVNYMIIPDSQERKKQFIFVISESDSDIVQKRLVEEEDFSINTDNGFLNEKELGIYPEIVVKELKDSFERFEKSKGIKKDFLYNVLCIYKLGNGKYSLKKGHKIVRIGDTPVSEAQEAVEMCLRDICFHLGDKYCSEEYSKNVLSYLRLPSTRNIIPVLEGFKNNDIRAFLEPIPMQEERNQKNREYINIYFQREDLDKVKEKIGPILDPNNTDRYFSLPLRWIGCDIGKIISEDIEREAKQARSK